MGCFLLVKTCNFEGFIVSEDRFWELVALKDLDSIRLELYKEFCKVRDDRKVLDLGDIFE